MDLMQRAKATMLLNREHTFFASLLLSTDIKPSKDVPTAATDMVRIVYNPDFIESLADVALVTFVLVHECMHIMLKHGLRMQGRNPRLWNVACDYAINWMLKESGFTIWKHCLVDAKYAGMSSEAIYESLQKKGEGKESSGQGGMGGDLQDVGDMAPEDRAVLDRAIQQKVAQAANMARMAGKMPGAIERLVDGILNPPLPWRTLLQEFATRPIKADESWSHRDRRIPHIYLPSRRSEAMGEIVVIGDTSGSMGDDVFSQIGQELRAIVEQLHPERVRVIWADDSECSRQEIFEDGDEILLHPLGGGGTDMRKPLKFVEQFDPIVTILVTDGLTPWPKEEPPYPLVVCCTTDHACPIGQVVRMLV